jgi:GcrA cell cycle regulator
MSMRTRPELIDQIRRLAAEGCSTIAIARALSVSAATVVRVARDCGITLLTRAQAALTRSQAAPSAWTPEREARLTKLWFEGFSTAQIAVLLGDGITRNAVIGKVNRLGLFSRAKAPATVSQRPRVKPARPAAPRPAASATRGNTAFALKPQSMPIARPQPADEVAVPMVHPEQPICEPVTTGSAGCTIMELREAMCRWPLGDPKTAEFRFCGGKKAAVGNGPYCAYHTRLAYQSAPKSRTARAC